MQTYISTFSASANLIVINVNNFKTIFCICRNQNYKNKIKLKINNSLDFKKFECKNITGLLMNEWTPSQPTIPYNCFAVVGAP